MKKVLVLLLATIMVLSCFVACGPKENDGNKDTNNSDQNESVETSKNDSTSEKPETTEVKIGNLDPSINLNEKTITVISRSHPAFKGEVSVETQDGNPINDAIFQRNLDIERILNCKIENILANENQDADYGVVNSVKNSLGPDCPYDIVSASAYTAFQNTASGICQDLLSVGNLELNQNYWVPYFNEEATIGHRQYFATGAISLSLRRFIFVTFFNTELAKQYDIENLYDVVRENRWTLDYQASILKDVFTELDGEEGQTEGDFYGLITNEHICVDPYWTACDAKILIKNKEDFFDLSPQVEKLDLIFEKIKDIYYVSGGTYVFQGEGGDVDQNKIRAKFTSSQAIMTTLRLLEVEEEDFRNMAQPYGILPMPKYDEAQDKYYSHAHDQFGVYGIVSSVSSLDVDNMGAFLECMAIEGYRTVTPAYFEMALKGKYSKDPESWEMLDEIVNNLKLDGGVLYTINLTDITQKFRDAVSENKANLSSTIFQGPMRKAIDRALVNMQNQIKAFQG